MNVWREGRGHLTDVCPSKRRTQNQQYLKSAIQTPTAKWAGLNIYVAWLGGLEKIEKTEKYWFIRLSDFFLSTLLSPEIILCIYLTSLSLFFVSFSVLLSAPPPPPTHTPTLFFSLFFFFHPFSLVLGQNIMVPFLVTFLPLFIPFVKHQFTYCPAMAYQLLNCL